MKDSLEGMRLPLTIGQKEIFNGDPSKTKIFNDVQQIILSVLNLPVWPERIKPIKKFYRLNAFGSRTDQLFLKDDFSEKVLYYHPWPTPHWKQLPMEMNCMMRRKMGSTIIKKHDYARSLNKRRFT
ncbi:MAG: hypothetical protein NC911_00890 [Candidatus Omnitrophica bacterium]|nr:hypothetical protein [Candidatus Omnitrophota bacterium]